jgi:hypothetical protein
MAAGLYDHTPAEVRRDAKPDVPPAEFIRDGWHRLEPGRPVRWGWQGVGRKAVVALVLLTAACLTDPEPECAQWAREGWSGWCFELDGMEMCGTRVDTVPAGAGEPAAFCLQWR